MKQTLLFILTLLSMSSFSQKTKRVKGKLTKGTEKYYVLKSDMKTKHGEYKVVSYTPPFRKLVLGEYINDKKEGIWTKWYDKSGKKIKSTGKYKNGRNIGVWTYYYSNGKLIQKYDFDNKIIIENTECNSNKKYLINLSGEIKETTLDCPPTLIGGLRTMVNELYNEIMKKSPFHVNENGRTNIKINETLSFYITDQETIENIKYSGSDKNSELNIIILDFIKRDTHNWIPGVLNEKKVSARVEVPIRISIMY